MKHYGAILILSTCAMACNSRPLHADVIAEFSFDGNTYIADPSNADGANTSLNLANGAAAVIGVSSISDLQFSPNLDADAALGFAAPNYNNALGFSTDVNNDRDFLTASQTVYFDVHVQSGYRLNLDSIQFDSLKTRAGNATGSRVTHSVFVNPLDDPAINGLSGAIDFVTIVAHDHFDPLQAGAESTGPNFSTGRYQVPAIDLSGFQNLTGTNTIAIRLYGSEGSDRDFGIDELIVHGAIAVPEPSGASLLLATGTLGMLLRRR